MATKDLEVLGSPGATEDLENIDMTWTDYGKIADDRAMWKSCVGQCVPRTRRRALTSKLYSKGKVLIVINSYTCITDSV